MKLSRTDQGSDKHMNESKGELEDNEVDRSNAEVGGLLEWWK